MEKLPSVLGITRLPFTLTVASGEAKPATVTLSEVTVWSSAGEVISSVSSELTGIGVSVGAGVGAGVSVGAGALLATDVGGGRRVSAGTRVAGGGGVGPSVGVATGVLAGLVVAVGSGALVGEAVGVATGAAVTAGGGAGAGVGVASWPPHAATSPVQANETSTTTGNHLTRKVRTVIPTLQRSKPLLSPVSNREFFV